MLTSIHITQLYVLDQDEALDFYVGKLGLEIADDVDMGFMRWLTIRVPGQKQTILLERPGGPHMSEETTAQVRELVSKGAAGGHLFFTTDDARATYARLVEAGAETTQEPTEQAYGVDFGVRDPFGNHLRVSQLKDSPEKFDDAALQRMRDAALPADPV